jgi:sigma-B regulation protein RsbU (phosphoserine phosphatase)
LRLTLTLPPVDAAPLSMLLALGILNPLVCLALGFGVAWLRPRDPRAWALLLLLVGFSQMSDVRGLEAARWGGPLRPFGLFWDTFLSNCWSIGMLLFGVSFPDRLALDRRRPWLKWLAVTPLAVHAAKEAALRVLDSESYAFAQPWLGRDAGLLAMLQMAAISTFFASLGFRAGTTVAPDARRRLKLLMWGACLGLTPIWIVILYGLFTRQAFGAGVPQPLLLAVLLLLPLFPITLAYAILVERALDVGVVVRQGLQYALARRGVAALQIVASVVVMLLVWNLVRDPTVNRPQSLRYLAWGILFVVLASRVATRAGAWIDRRFFREAVDAERLLSELSEEVRTIVEEDKLLETVARRIADALHVPKVAALLRRGQQLEVAHQLGYGAGLSATLALDGPTARRLRETGAAAHVYLDDPESWANRDAGTEQERPVLLALDTQLLLPLARKAELLGLLSLGHKQSEQPYSASDVRLLRSVAGQTALALENSRLTAEVAAEVARAARLKREVEIAREVQEQLFPQNYPSLPGLDVAGRCRPASGVGGDYYDFLALKNGGLGVAIGDVSGKGIPAALLMAGLQASLRGQTLAGSRDLAALMNNVNLLIVDASPANRYATFFYGQYDPTTRRLAYVNAGHNAPMLFRAGAREPLRLADGGPVVGLLHGAAFREAAISLEAGDLLVGFTDGISECMNKDEEEWGEDRLIAAIGGCDGLPAAGVIDRVMAAADAFADGAKQHDDMTLIVVRLLDPGAPPL